MCHTSTYEVRCSGCGETLEHRLEIDQMCRGKRRINSCTLIVPVNVHLDWLDPSNCLVCLAKPDILEAIEEDRKKRAEAKQKADMIWWKGEDEEDKMREEKKGRVEKWVDETVGRKRSKSISN
ncbi:hypothetical protein FGRMN_1258 [Fusarium graminum]|nr:hypothetical protein FGRMN_1258 [Fusarium graminum]